MRDGIHWRGNHRGRRRQQENDLNQNSVRLSRRQGRRRAAKFLILCLILCLRTWTKSRTSWVPLPIITESISHQEPTRGIVFQLFRNYRYPQACNRTLMALIPVHRSRNSLHLDGDSSDTPGKHLLGSASQDVFDKDEHEGQGVEVSPVLQYGQSSKKRKGQPGVVHCHPQQPLVSTQATLGRWPVLGGLRESDLDIQPFYVKVPIGSGKNLQEYFMHVDTGSGVSWVMCKGRGPITSVGPNGLYKPKTDSFLDCKRDEELCKGFQEDIKHPCNRKHKFRCIFDHEYGDGLTIEGHIVLGDVCFEASDGSHAHVHIAFGCADKVDDENTKKEGQTIASTDGLIGLGPHRASWLHQLILLGLIKEYVIAICFEPALRDMSHVPGSQLPEPAGFLSFGNLYSAQAVRTIWTANIPSDSKEYRAMYTGRLQGIRYRKTVLVLKEGNRKKKNTGIHMGFDTGSDLTYLTTKTYDALVKILDMDAKQKGYFKTHDSNEFEKEEARKCWSKGSKKSSVKDFGDLILMFSSLANDDTTSDLVIKPKHYITLGGFGKHQRTCFNVLKEMEFNFGNLGAEVLRGHLIVFNNNLNQIGWRAVKSCENLE